MSNFTVATEDPITAAALQAELIALKGDVDAGWLIFAASLVFFMQGGFAILEAGSVRAKNARNILLKNVLDSAVAALTFCCFGWAFAYGTNCSCPSNYQYTGGVCVPNTSDLPPAELDCTGSNWFIGSGQFFLMGLTENSSYAGWLFQFAFAATAATIVSGSVAERIQFRAYVVYSIVITGIVYPVVVHWVWSPEGWLSAFAEHKWAENGMIDFAGSGVVHMTGGFCGLAGALVLGPRSGRFEADGRVNAMPGHNSTFAALGVMILFFGWFGFNAGSTLVLAGAGDVAGKALVTTVLSAGSSCLTTVALVKLVFGDYDLINALNGILAGLVAITAGCAVVEPFAAIIIGFFAAFIFLGAAELLLRFKIDDPLAAAPIHGFVGYYGVVMVGLFATKPNLIAAYGRDESLTQCGLFYCGNGHLLGVQIVGGLSIAAWSFGLATVVFVLLKQAGWLRVTYAEELLGLDVSHHGGQAYDHGAAKGTYVDVVESAIISVIGPDGQLDIPALERMIANNKKLVTKVLKVDSAVGLLSKHDLNATGSLSPAELELVYRDLRILKTAAGSYHPRTPSDFDITYDTKATSRGLPADEDASEGENEDSEEVSEEDEDDD